MHLRHSRPRGTLAPRLSMLTMMYPRLAMYWFQRSPPPHTSCTVELAGSPYTSTITGYFFVGSKSMGFIIQASRVRSPDFVFTNSLGFSPSAAYWLRASALSSITRTERWRGNDTMSMTGGVAALLNVCTAHFPVGDMW